MAERRMLAGRYRIDGLLGQGGMGEIHFGHDERLDRPVAIKLLKQTALPATVDSPEAIELRDEQRRNRERFLREIRTTASLEITGVPAIYDTGIGDGDQLWVVMQLLRGSTLEAVLDHTDYETRPPPVAWAAAITAQIAAVLAEVHRVDIVHRDITPTNVMIVDGGLVKVLDFGIAILRGASALPRLTQLDRTVGTPPYMSPEQHLGRMVNAASDIYSLGCLLHQMLTGDAPFQANANVSLREHHLKTTPRSVRDHRTEIPAAVADLVAAMLAKDASARPGAEAVYDVLAPLASIVDKARGEVKNDPTLPFRKPLLTPPPSGRAVADRAPLTTDGAENVLIEAQALLDTNRPIEAVSLLDDAAAHAGQDKALALRLRYFLGMALFYADEYTRAAKVLDAVGSDLREHLPPADQMVMNSAYHAGHAYAEIGNPAKALSHLRFYLHHAADDDPAKRVESRFVAAQLLAATGQIDEAVTELKAIRPQLADIYGPNSTQLNNLDKHIKRLESNIGGS